MNVNKKQLFPKVAWFLVFCPAEFWVSRYILWASQGDAKVGEFGFLENVFVYGYWISWFNSSLYFIRIDGPNEQILGIKTIEW